MTDSCQISTNLLESMSIDELIDIAMDYPLLIDMYLFDDYEEGFNAVLNDFNGLQELMSRDDLIEVLFNKYENLELSESADFNEVASLELLEMMLVNEQTHLRYPKF